MAVDVPARRNDRKGDFFSSSIISTSYKTADYLIDLGPEGGQAGGRVVATGTP